MTVGEPEFASNCRAIFFSIFFPFVGGCLNCPTHTPGWNSLCTLGWVHLPVSASHVLGYKHEVQVLAVYTLLCSVLKSEVMTLRM